MTHGRSWSRRLVLGGFVCGMVSAGVLRPPRHDVELAELGDAIAALVPGSENAAAIGRAYLRESPAEASADRLRALLLPARTAFDLSARIRDDFAFGRVTPVQGWVLSLTEARCCAFVALSQWR